MQNKKSEYTLNRIFTIHFNTNLFAKYSLYIIIITLIPIKAKHKLVVFIKVVIF